MNESYPQAKLGYGEKVCTGDNSQHNPTVGENLELRIKMLKEELARLEASRATLAPLLEMRIRDIRDAMNY